MVDITGVYLHASIDDVVFVKFQGKMVELLVKIDPKICRPYVEIDKSGGKVLYAQLRKALYGCLKSGLLFWKNLTTYLYKMGFTLNRYDTCIANKIIYGKQCTVIWHVDDLKISHVNPNVVTGFIDTLSKKYEEL